MGVQAEVLKRRAVLVGDAVARDAGIKPSRSFAAVRSDQC
jgi:hypothetical protein